MTSPKLMLFIWFGWMIWRLSGVICVQSHLKSHWSQTNLFWWMDVTRIKSDLVSPAAAGHHAWWSILGQSLKSVQNNQPSILDILIREVRYLKALLQTIKLLSIDNHILNFHQQGTEVKCICMVQQQNNLPFLLLFDWLCLYGGWVAWAFTIWLEHIVSVL